MKKLFALLGLLAACACGQDTKVGSLTHRTTPYSTSDVMVWAIPGVSDYNMQWTDLTNVLGGYWDAIGAANAATNGFPWGVLYDPAGAAHNATNGYPWTNLPVYGNGAGLTNIAASNIVSGGVLPVGAVAAVAAGGDGWVLGSSNGVRNWSRDGGALTNLQGANVVGNIAGDGANLTNLSAGNVASGTLAEARSAHTLTNVTISGPFYVPGDAQRTNAIYYDASGLWVSNAAGVLRYKGGDGIASTNLIYGGWGLYSNGLWTTCAGFSTSTGTVTSASFSGAGTGLTGTASGLSIGGNAATATAATYATNTCFATNSQTTAVNMTIPWGRLQTASAVVFTAVNSVSVVNPQTAVVIVTNTTGAAVSISTSVTGVHTNGALPYNCTNVSAVNITVDSGTWTNMLVYPLW